MATLALQVRKNNLFGYLFYGGLALFAISAIAFNLFRPVIVLPHIALAPGYALSDINGQSVTSEDMRGKLTLYTFSYSRCQGSHCPELAAVQQQLSQQNVTDLPISLVIISLEPEWDTLAVLSDYGQDSLGDRSGRVAWHFLTGDALLVRTIVGNGFNLYYKREGDAQVKFEPRFFLVDGLGIVRAEYHTTRPEPNILLRDIHLMSEEAQNSQGLTRLAYEAAHLFLCYPH